MKYSGSQGTAVSIIIPYLEDRGFLSEAIASAEAQAFDSFEVIIWQGDHSLGKNINDALKVAKGEWIKILAEDDLLPVTSIADLWQYAKRGTYDWLCGDAHNFGLLGNDWQGHDEWIGHKVNLKEMTIRNQIHGGTTMYKKSMLFEVGGYDECITTGEEYDLHLLLLDKGYKLGYVPKVVYEYRLHEYNKSMDMSVKAKELRKAYIREIANRYK